jgi:hypothetical protein
MPAKTVAPRFTRAHYELIAAILNRRFYAEDGNETGRWVVDAVADDLCEVFAADNPRFDRDRFVAACGIEW